MAETTKMNPEEEVFDPLDMNNYKVEKLPKMQKSGFEKWMARVGGPLAILVFVLIYWVADIGFLNDITAENLVGDKAIKRLDTLGLVDFVRINYAMLAIFAAAIVLWVTEAIPSYLTSLLVILGVVLTGVAPQKEAFAQLGHPVMWLNILSFVLASMLVKTRVAKRFALWFVLRFGRNATGVFFSFIVINLVLSMFISATAVKASILLPIFMVVAAIYGAGNGVRNNFGRNLVLQNLLAVNVGASGFMTGAGAHLLAVSLIAGVVGGYAISYTEWLYAALPMAIVVLIIGWLVGTKLIFPMKKEEQKPQIEGGMERLQNELKAMGKVTFEEIKAVAIFVGVLILWVTKEWHGIDETTVAFIGAVVALMPGIGIVKWNDVDIPWHLMLFSAGAYVLGTGLNATDLHTTLVNNAYDALGITAQTPFWVIYVVLTGLMMFSGLIFSSKTMRTMIFVPIAIATAQKFGYPIMSLAFPVALLIDHVYVLPFNSKPAALLYTTNHYSWSDTFKFGFALMIISWMLMLVWGETVLKWLGFTPGLF